MAERAAHLVDHVFPDDVPVRQWVLSLPHRLRYILAWDHDLCRAVAAIMARAVSRVLGVARDAAERPTPGPCQAEANGFSLHAGLVVPAGRRDRLERVCRYVLRPPVAAERLELTGDGQVRLSLRPPWRNGTTALVFDPVSFLGRLAVLVPRPRVNLVLYYGVLGARSAWRLLTRTR